MLFIWRPGALPGSDLHADFRSPKSSIPISFFASLVQPAVSPSAAESICSVALHAARQGAATARSPLGFAFPAFSCRRLKIPVWLCCPRAVLSSCARFSACVGSHAAPECSPFSVSAFPARCLSLYLVFGSHDSSSTRSSDLSISVRCSFGSAPSGVRPAAPNILTG
jgi:hypothetical protein